MLNQKKILVIIPAKGNSSRLKNKNILEINGLPLVIRAAKEVLKSRYVDTVFVSTESQKIKNICQKYNVDYINRPKKLSGSKTEKQEVIVHVTKHFKKNYYKPDIIISLQCNSPEFNFRDLDKALVFFEKKLHPDASIKEVISINKDYIQNAAFRILTYDAVFQKTLSTKLGVVITNYSDIHTYKQFLKSKRYLEQNKKNKFH
tara:strand:- start:3672 stop:4280 length:609 start_codon:yes stop_codon:yes gene_type:complete